MDRGENNEDQKKSSGFKNVVKALHKKTKLPSLRTYKGDIAEFIKKKDESVASIVIKEKKRKEEKEKKEAEEKIEEKNKEKDKGKGKEKKKKEKRKEKPKKLPQIKKRNLQVNFVMIFLSLVLIAAGFLAFIYIYNSLKEEPVPEVVIKTEIIPYNNLINLANMTKETLKSELVGLESASGINLIKISDTNGRSLSKIRDFFKFLEISPSDSLERTLENDYVIGIMPQEGKNSVFLIMTVDDFGGAFSSMLVWEETIAEDLSFLVWSSEAEDVFAWKDIIIKNKDVRGLIDQNGQVTRIAYTFLDKNTILIANDIFIITDISSAYAARSIAR